MALTRKFPFQITCLENVMSSGVTELQSVWQWGISRAPKRRSSLQPEFLLLLLEECGDTP